jgi:hypothetical protein
VRTLFTLGNVTAEEDAHRRSIGVQLQGLPTVLSLIDRFGVAFAAAAGPAGVSSYMPPPPRPWDRFRPATVPAASSAEAALLMRGVSASECEEVLVKAVRLLANLVICADVGDAAVASPFVLHLLVDVLGA